MSSNSACRSESEGPLLRPPTGETGSPGPGRVARGSVTRRMADSRRLRSIGLVRCSANPAPALCCRSSSEPNPLMAMPGNVRPPPRPCNNSRPVPSGSSMSLIRRSKWASSAAARAAETRSTGTTL